MINHHATGENHIIDWQGAEVSDRDPHKRRRHVREAIWISKTEWAINRDEVKYELSHIYDDSILQEHRHSHGGNHPGWAGESLCRSFMKGYVTRISNIYLRKSYFSIPS